MWLTRDPMEELEDHKYIDATAELHVFASSRGRIPRQLATTFGQYVQRLNLSSCQLRFTRGLEMFVFLEELVLDNNELQVLEICHLPRLRTLTVNNNQLQDLDALLTNLQRCAARLRYLSLLGNPCSPDQLAAVAGADAYTAQDYSRHRLYVLFMMRHLQFLDWRRVTCAERAEAGRRGSYCRTARLVKWDETSAPSGTELAEDALHCDTRLTPCQPRRKGPVYGQLTHKYTGKHSEGNRFIGNSDL